MNDEPIGDDNRSSEEVSLFSLRNFALAVLSLVVMIGLVQVFAGILSNFFSRPQLARLTQLPPEPRLQVAPAQEFQPLKATQEAQINTYGWIDRSSGIVHIPIDQAMQLYVERGQPGGAPPATNTPGVQGAQGTPSAVEQGAQIFQQLGCAACHTGEENAPGPRLQGLFGTQVQLKSGQTVTADESYIRESILMPEAKVVAGYQAVMPSFSGRVSDEQLAALVAYVKSLGNQ